MTDCITQAELITEIADLSAELDAACRAISALLSECLAVEMQPEDVRRVLSGGRR